MNLIHSGESLYIMADEKTTLNNGRELFSFGSGSWCDGEDGRDAMESSASFIPCKVTLDTMIILKRKRILTHLSELHCLEKAVTLRELLTSLEDHGEAGNDLVLSLMLRLLDRSRLPSRTTRSTSRRIPWYLTRRCASCWTKRLRTRRESQAERGVGRIRRRPRRTRRPTTR